MGGGLDKRRQIWFSVLVVLGFGLCVAAAHKCSHGHEHEHEHDHHHQHEYDVIGKNQRKLLPEEIAEEEDLRLMWAHSDVDHEIQHRHSGQELSGFGLWTHAMACSLLVSLASLICLILLPIIFIQGKPSKIVVDSLALFGAGAMLGDAFLHQLPHAFGGEHSLSHDHHDDHSHHDAGSGHSHSHSLKDLSVGLSVLGGIVVFLIVEKLVRYVEEFSGGVDLGHHHHHHNKHTKKLKDDDGTTHEDHQESFDNDVVNGKLLNDTSEEKESPGSPSENASDGKPSEKTLLRKRNTSNSGAKDGTDSSGDKISDIKVQHMEKKETTKTQSSLVFGYLNLFSDGVHNFTDGMALGSAFLVYGSVSGWSRTLFLLAHELPQEIGDFGILVRSGFSVSKALFFNFLSALMALAGTALALLWGQDPGQSSLIEGFTAGGFIYIALAGVLAEMNASTTALRHTMTQLVALLLGMAVALCISLVE